MTFPRVPDASAVAEHFARALRAARRDDTPYRHWALSDVLPEDLAVGVLVLPIVPPIVGDSHGVRDTDNRKRTFFTPELRARFPTCAAFAEGLQGPQIARLFQETCGIEVAGGYLRMEYIQDIDGAWLEPHRDIPEKLFSMVLYLCTGPEAKEWGTDIYDSERRRVGRTSAQFNSAVIFVPGPDTWHGFEPRPICGVRRLLEINYVRSDWRDRDQLAFPDRPIVVA
ncbi:MAG TPA: 2OG-Fe(II) oxygenase [Chromatiales bacterium]|nr:2OG-Fe(II) oxygenase [Chromatiales bacterium]